MGVPLQMAKVLVVPSFREPVEVPVVPVHIALAEVPVVLALIEVPVVSPSTNRSSSCSCTHSTNKGSACSLLTAL